MNHRIRHPEDLQPLLIGRVQRLLANGDWPSEPPRAILPGSFDPLHEGHQQMAEVAARRLGCPVAYELSVQNVDKPSLVASEILRRIAEMPSNCTAWLTRAATFANKAELFPETTFVVGVDTIQRVADLGYYSGGAVGRDRTFRQLRDRGCRFLVFGRSHWGVFCELPDCRLPPLLEQLCDGVPQSEFRNDSSSTKIRQAANSASRSRRHHV